MANQQGPLLPHYSVVPSAEGLALVVNNAQFSSNQGEYTCRASSNGVTITASANLNVLCT